MDTSKLLMLGGAAVAGWFVYENFFAGPPADAKYIGQLTNSNPTTAPLNGGGTQTVTGPGYVYFSPSANQYYVTQTAPTAAQIPAATPPTPSTTGSNVTTSPAVTTPPASTAPPASTPPATAAPPANPAVLAGIWAKAQAAAAQDAKYIASGGLLTPYQWNFYLNYVQPAAPAGFTGSQWPPDPVAVFPAGFDMTSEISSQAYWYAMQSALVADGLSGLGCGCDSGSNALWLIVGAAAAAGVLAYFGGQS